jgi:hypothetical protein
MNLLLVILTPSKEMSISATLTFILSLLTIGTGCIWPSLKPNFIERVEPAKSKNSKKSKKYKESKESGKIKVTTNGRWYFSTVGAMILLTIASYFVQGNEQEEYKAINATVGTMVKKIKPRKNGNVHLRFGAFDKVVPISMLQKDYVFEAMSFGKRIVDPTIRLDGDKLLVTHTLRDVDDRIVAIIKDNECEIVNSYFRRNYDETGFEVIDGYGITKMQIRFVNDSTILCSGLFKVPNNYIRIYDGKTDMYGPDMSKQGLIMASEEIPNLFIYPAETHLHERNPNHHEDFDYPLGFQFKQLERP